MDKPSSKFCLFVSQTEESFITLSISVNVMKLFNPSLIERQHKLVFASGKPFLPSIIFSSKAESYPIGAPGTFKY
jgi:hypothetical protein